MKEKFIKIQKTLTSIILLYPELHTSLSKNSILEDLREPRVMIIMWRAELGGVAL